MPLLLFFVKLTPHASTARPETTNSTPVPQLILPKSQTAAYLDDQLDFWNIAIGRAIFLLVILRHSHWSLKLEPNELISRLASF